MTLEESLRKLDELIEQERMLMKEIRENHIHNENDELVYNRYRNAGNVSFRKYMLKKIKEGKNWESLLDNFPVPDKPFNIEDIQCADTKECFMRILKLEKKGKELGNYINNNFEHPEINRIIKRSFEEKYGMIL